MMSKFWIWVVVTIILSLLVLIIIAVAMVSKAKKALNGIWLSEDKKYSIQFLDTKKNVDSEIVQGVISTITIDKKKTILKGSFIYKKFDFWRYLTSFTGHTTIKGTLDLNKNIQKVSLDIKNNESMRIISGVEVVEYKKLK